MLFGTLGASLIGHMLAGQKINRAGEGICKSWLWKQKVWKTTKKNKKKTKFLKPPYSLTNFEIQKYYQNQTRFNGIYSTR